MQPWKHCNLPKLNLLQRMQFSATVIIIINNNENSLVFVYIYIPA
jgi:hypothetical protein